jgi:arabinogalactan endo-1,4-beta-galactosidase
VNTGFIREKALLLHDIAKELLAKLVKFAGAAISAVLVDFSYSDYPEDPLTQQTNPGRNKMF